MEEPPLYPVVPQVITATMTVTAVPAGRAGLLLHHCGCGYYCSYCLSPGHVYLTVIFTTLQPTIAVLQGLSLPRSLQLQYYRDCRHRACYVDRTTTAVRRLSPSRLREDRTTTTLLRLGLLLLLMPSPGHVYLLVILLPIGLLLQYCYRVQERDTIQPSQQCWD